MFEEFCKEVAKAEGLTDEVEMGNVREMVSIVFGKLKKMTVEEMVELISHSRK